ncbi:MAG: hypothetical protein IPM45_07535 [Acidimicrobiales bacterium]|nr:hypothetical protein [Acidimicrobiales bacterium]
MAPTQGQGQVLRLGCEKASDAAAVGAKAANLARATSAGLPVLPGFVLCAGHAPGHDLSEEVLDALRSAWLHLDGDSSALVVRSSSTAEDIATSSMAGQFRSVTGVRGWPAFLVAVATVLASAERPGGATARPMGVLVQPHLDVVCGGVLFGLDPVRGDRRHIVIEAVAGQPEELVSGRAIASRFVTTRRGRLLSLDRGGDGPRLDRATLRALAALARRAERVFGSPQDVEWGIDGDGRLWMLQSRPITAAGPGTPRGPVLGPGPVAETFAGPLHPLDVDLWVRPMADGIDVALVQAGLAPRRRHGPPAVTVVGGWAAADLERLGYRTATRRWWYGLEPRRLGRRLWAAWRIGRLRAGLAAGATALVERVDTWLAAVPPLPLLDDADLLALVERATRTLRTLHAHEVLAATLLSADQRKGGPDGPTAAALALTALALGRAGGLGDAALCHRHPEVLALTTPRVGPPAPLPAAPPAATVRTLAATLVDLEPREALRLRVRWVQELGARAATVLGDRLAARGRLPDPLAVRGLTLDGLAATLAGATVAVHDEAPGPPLPASFRLGPGGEVVPVAAPPADAGIGAGGGRGVGPACHGSLVRPPRPGDVLVLRTLDPTLAPVLAGLAGLVAETGSTLSHLAILAREQRVPTVVAVPDALQRFPDGTRLLVDGTTGEVAAVAHETVAEGGP